MQNLNIGVHWKIRSLQGGVTKNLYKGTNCLKKGREDLDSLQIKEGTW